MEVFKPGSDAWNRKWRSSNQVLTLRYGNGIVRDIFKARNREWKSSSQDRSLESEMEEFEPSSRFGIGNGGVRAKFRSLESGMEEFKPSLNV